MSSGGGGGRILGTWEAAHFSHAQDILGAVIHL